MSYTASDPEDEVHLLSHNPDYLKRKSLRQTARRKARFDTDPEYKARIQAKRRLRSRKNGKSPAVKAEHVEARLFKDYGLRRSDLDRLLVTQRGQCAICLFRMVLTGRSIKSLNIDHIKGTKTVRGLLCHGCNLGLGLFTDNPHVLRAAADYLLTNDPRWR